jgi:transposase-like protein
VEVKGRWTYLYRAVDKVGRTIDFYLSERRDANAAKHFFRKAMKSVGPPRVITLDAYAASHRAVRELKSEGQLPRRVRVVDWIIGVEKESFFRKERTRRPPLDDLNALLSFLYTLLAGDCVGALESVGLYPAVGFLYQDRPGRPSLALDLMEELRSVLAD